MFQNKLKIISPKFQVSISIIPANVRAFLLGTYTTNPTSILLLVVIDSYLVLKKKLFYLQVTLMRFRYNAIDKLWSAIH